ncbi:Retrovirus-related Pol polyprotein from transposon 17.6, partial [Mucuna pruriens]
MASRASKFKQMAYLGAVSDDNSHFQVLLEVKDDKRNLTITVACQPSWNKPLEGWDDCHEESARRDDVDSDSEQLAKKLAGKSHYCFLDGFFGYMQIHIALVDQHKTTFTCPFGTFAYTWMPFGLCNASSTFHRCMISIFSDLLEDCMEFFMDDFTMYAELFDACLENLSRGIVLGHLVSSRGIEVDKAKVDIIASLPNPASVQEVRSFLRHAGFYRRSIKNFNKITLPLSKLLKKDVDFIFDQPYMEALQEL